ncbi:MAG: DUF2007 domain-containing protein [Hyphomicrobiales bacterium]|nr:DUF2007 domain-containing protein [Hyphomicrobiales bacterium]
MIELMRTNDMVLISLIEALFAESSIGYFIADAHMSMLEGSTGFMARRIMVAREDAAQARRILRDAAIDVPKGPADGG